MNVLDRADHPATMLRHIKTLLEPDFVGLLDASITRYD